MVGKAPPASARARARPGPARLLARPDRPERPIEREVGRPGGAARAPLPRPWPSAATSARPARQRRRWGPFWTTAGRCPYPVPFSSGLWCPLVGAPAGLPVSLSALLCACPSAASVLPVGPAPRCPAAARRQGPPCATAGGPRRRGWRPRFAILTRRPGEISPAARAGGPWARSGAVAEISSVARGPRARAGVPGVSRRTSAATFKPSAVGGWFGAAGISRSTAASVQPAPRPASRWGRGKRGIFKLPPVSPAIPGTCHMT